VTFILTEIYKKYSRWFSNFCFRRITQSPICSPASDVCLEMPKSSNAEIVHFSLVIKWYRMTFSFVLQMFMFYNITL
jgi:hypothetical protein